MSSYATRDLAELNATRMMKESGADAVKLQGRREMFDIINAVADAGVFPDVEHTYTMKPEEADRLANTLKGEED